MARKNIADSIFINCNINDISNSYEFADAFSVRDGKYDQFGTAAEIKSLSGPSTITTDLRGKTVISGLTDSHFHHIYFGMTSSWIDFSNSTKVDDVYNKVKKHLQNKPPGVWVYGRGLNFDKLSAQSSILSKSILDSIGPRNPILISRADGHACFANSDALEKAGIMKTTADPPGGSILRDEHGIPTGLLLEAAVYLPWNSMMSHLNPTDFEAAINKSNSVLLKNGITSSHAVLLENMKNETYALKQLADQKKLKVRIYGIVGEESLDTLPTEIKNYENDWLNIKGAKLFADGTIMGRTARLSKPYSDSLNKSGTMLFSSSELKKKLLSIRSNNFQPVIHAVGDEAITQVIIGLTSVYSASKLKEIRPRIEHASVLSQNLLRTAKELGIILSLQGHNTSRIQQRLGYQRFKWSNPWKEIYASQTLALLGSDAPFIQSEPGTWSTIIELAENGVPIDHAIKMSTYNAAFGSFSEKTQGKISKGNLADFTVLSQNPRLLSIDELRNSQPEMTIVGGEIKWNI